MELAARERPGRPSQASKLLGPRLAAHRLLPRDAQEGPDTFWESSLWPLKMRPTGVCLDKGKSSQQSQGVSGVAQVPLTSR